MLSPIPPNPIRPALREEVCLNGAWEQGGQVPVYAGLAQDMLIYQRQVTVPEAWDGKVIRLEFEKVNHIADVYIDGRFLGDHVGGWIPFAFDLTRQVKPGKPFTLTVIARSANHQPVSDGRGHLLWPDGTRRKPRPAAHAGIVDDVWLRAYGLVHFEDAFIQTSFRSRRITLDYVLKNEAATPANVRLEAEIIRADTGEVEKNLAAAPLTLAVNESKAVQLGARWANPALWMPDSPCLYLLHSRILWVRENQTTILDEETRRFGFREVWIDGNQFRLNGVRVNLWGDSIPMAWFPYEHTAGMVTPDTWPQTLEMLKNELNLRVIRFQQSPAPNFALEAADEKGLLVIDESALYGGGDHYSGSDQPALMRNICEGWVGPWIKGHRNHPSIVMWSATNEMHSGIDLSFSKEQCLAVGSAIQAFDPTRPITYDGEGDVGGEVINDHYPEGYETLEAVRNGSIYEWENHSYNPAASLRPHPSKPTGFGEFLACPWVESIQPDVYWWQGTWVRGLRYLNFTDIRPYLMQWAWDGSQPEAKENLKNSFAAVALFDYDYDGLGIDPLVKKQYPLLRSGEKVTRHLVLYNDEVRDPFVEVNVEIRCGAKLVASGRQAFQVMMGEHRDLACTFQAPWSADQVLEVILSTYKGGVRKFLETRRFQVRGENRPLASSDASVEIIPSPAGEG